MERERLRREVADAAWNERQNAAVTARADETGDPETGSGAEAGTDSGTQTARQAQDTPRTEDPLWRRGMTAYAKARDMLLADAARSRGTRLAVA